MTTLDGRLLIVRIGKHPFAFPLADVVGLLPSGATTTGTGNGDWIIGSVRFQRQDVPFISLCQKLRFKRAAEAVQGIVTTLADIWLAVEFDEILHVAPAGSYPVHSLPPGVSELGSSSLTGYVVAQERGGYLLNVASLFDDDDMMALGDYLL